MPLASRPDSTLGDGGHVVRPVLRRKHLPIIELKQAA
jgi:hypothetical protein